MLKASENAFKLVKHFESIHDGDLTKIGLQPKLCPAGIVTIGYGHALINPITKKWLTDINDVEKYYPQFLDMSIEDADDLLKSDVEKFEKQVNNSLKVTVSQNQFDALVSHTFNTGGSETLFALINNNNAKNQIEAWWTTHYITSKGVTLNGLIRRRKSEYELYENNTLNFFE